MFEWLRRQLRPRKKYEAGATLSRFLAPDIKREIEVVDASEVEAGFVTARIRTWNLLRVARNMAIKPEFGPPRRVAIDDLWTWTGERWGGPIPDDDIGRAK